MNKRYFCGIKYSQHPKLKDEFPDAEWRWVLRYAPALDEYKFVITSQIWLKEYKVRQDIEHYPALHTDLLLERLPMTIKIDGLSLKSVLVIGKVIGRYSVSYRNSDCGYREEFKDQSLPNALAKMLIWLKENDHD